MRNDECYKLFNLSRFIYSNSAYNIYSNMNEEMLISLVHKYPELYDKGDKQYHDHQRRKVAWKEIAGILNENPIKCKGKWKKIRENFKKAISLRRVKSEQGTVMSKPIRHADELRFIIPHLEFTTESLTNFSSDEEHLSIESSPSSPYPVKTELTRKENPTNSHSFLQSLIENNYTNDPIVEDPIVDFFKNLGHTVKSFPPDLKHRVKRAVFDIVSEAEEELIARDMPENVVVCVSTPKRFKRS